MRVARAGRWACCHIIAGRSCAHTVPVGGRCLHTMSCVKCSLSCMKCALSRTLGVLSQAGRGPVVMPLNHPASVAIQRPRSRHQTATKLPNHVATSKTVSRHPRSKTVSRHQNLCCDTFMAKPCRDIKNGVATPFGYPSVVLLSRHQNLCRNTKTLAAQGPR